MDRQFLSDRLSQNIPVREIAKESGKGYSTVRYWITKYGLKVESRQRRRCYPEGLRCSHCRTVLPRSRFYTRADGRPSSWCISCVNGNVTVRQRALKKKAVEYKGGKCQECGYDRCLAALEFHHLDPEHKDFNLAAVSRTKWNEKTQQELDKCACLCANCHRETHAGLLHPR